MTSASTLGAQDSNTSLEKSLNQTQIKLKSRSSNQGNSHAYQNYAIKSRNSGVVHDFHLPPMQSTSAIEK